MQQLNQNIKVAVTGASGYIASHIVKILLQKGYQVIGTVRNLDDKYKFEHLYELKNSKENLTLKSASLDSQENEFIEIFKDCKCVFHTASPVFFQGSEEQIVTPAIQGTQKVLDAIKQNSSTITNLVYTSSMASVKTQNSPLQNETFTDKDWSDIPKMKENKNYYALSKTLAEQMVIEFSKQNSQIATVQVNPTVVQGPTISNIANYTLQQCVIDPITKNNYEIGEFMFYKIIDVRDLAEIHVNAFMQNRKNERYITIGDDFTIDTYAKCLQQSVNNFNLDYKIQEKQPSEMGLQKFQYKHDSSLAEKVLGRPFTKLQKILDDTIESLIQRKFLEKQQ